MDRTWRSVVAVALLGVVLVTGGCIGASPGDPGLSPMSVDGTTRSAGPAEPSGTTVADPRTTTRDGDSSGVTATGTSTGTGVGTATTTADETPVSGQGWTVTVVRVIDGDTIEVRFPDGHTENVRLLGVDTPEVHVANDPPEFEGIPDTDAGNAWLRDWGHRASEFARAELGGETVTIAVDPVADRRGSYGRLLVYLYHDGGVFNRQLLDQGYARVYDSRFSERATYDAIERQAQSEGIGLWGFDGDLPDPTPTETASEPPGDSALVVAAVHADAAGNDHENQNGEYVTLRNDGDSRLELGGWRVSDAAGHTYVFPDGFALGPGESVRLYTGSGTDTDSELYWGADGAVWNNGGDVVVVTDGSGTVVARRAYP